MTEEERVDYDKQYRKDNLEKIREYDRQRHKDNREKRLEKSKKYYKNNPEKAKERHLKGKYNLSLKDWEGLWYAQDGRCAICGKFIKDSKNICVDHNHKTGEVRSLLCQRCNIGLGYIEDSEFNIKAIKYLEEK